MLYIINNQPFISVALLSLFLCTTGIPNGSAATPSDNTTKGVVADKSWYTHPNKSTSDRKGDYSVNRPLSGAVVPLIYPKERPWYSHPNKSGVDRKGDYSHKRPLSGAVIPLIYPKE